MLSIIKEELTMKKLLVLLLPVLVIALLAGCGKKPEIVPEGPTEPQVEDKTPPTDQKPPATTEVEEAVVPDFVTIYFDFDKYNLRSDAKRGLQTNVQVMKDNAKLRILIEGHCDERGTVEYNLALGEKRARSARDYMVSLGIDAARIEIISYGKERPVDPGHNETAWAKNRRAEFLITN